MRSCKICGEEFPIVDMVIAMTTETKRYYKNICKPCAAKKTSLVYYLRKDHPYPSEDYQCPICLGSNLKWYLDHDWDTKEFRGWLCNNCNSALGKLHDDVVVLERAIKYLAESKGLQ